MEALKRINAERAARRPQAVIARMITAGCTLFEIAAAVPSWSVAKIRAYLIERDRNK
jgi:hypothetical protein